MQSFEGKTIIVTGAAGNLGSAVARRFANAGARVIAVDHQTGRLAECLPELASGGHWLAEPFDVADPDSMSGLVEEIRNQKMAVTGLINVVGGFEMPGRVDETPLESWERMMALNARTTFVASRAIIPLMLEAGGGAIVNIASGAALHAGAKTAAYSAAKSAVVSLTESMAAGYKKDGLRTNCVLPDTIDSPENRKARPGADFSRWATPEAIADVILFLASDAARAINGAAIPVTGSG